MIISVWSFHLWHVLKAILRFNLMTLISYSLTHTHSKSHNFLIDDTHGNSMKHTSNCVFINSVKMKWNKWTHAVFVVTKHTPTHCEALLLWQLNKSCSDPSVSGDLVLFFTHTHEHTRLWTLCTLFDYFSELLISTCLLTWLCGLLLCLMCGPNIMWFFQPFISLQVIGVCGEISKVSLLLMSWSNSLFMVHVSLNVMISQCSFPQRPLAAMKMYLFLHPSFLNILSAHIHVLWGFYYLLSPNYEPNDRRSEMIEMLIPLQLFCVV